VLREPYRVSIILFNTVDELCIHKNARKTEEFLEVLNPSSLKGERQPAAMQTEEAVRREETALFIKN